MLGTKPSLTGSAPGQGLAAALLPSTLACGRLEHLSFTWCLSSRYLHVLRALGPECSTLRLGGLAGAVTSGQPSLILGSRIKEQGAALSRDTEPS